MRFYLPPTLLTCHLKTDITMRCNLRLFEKDNHLDGLTTF
jgi:hypothetical protein